MSTKEVMVTAPVVVLLYDWMFLAGSLTEALRRRRWLYAGLALTWLWLAYLVVSTGLLSDLSSGLEGPRGRADRWTYAATEPGVILYYLRLSVWPNPLVFDYAWPAAKGVGEIVPAALAIGVLLGTTIWGLLTRRTWAFLGASFFLILSPTSSIVPLFDDYIFEHRMYLALAAVLTGLVLAGYAGRRACASRGWVPGAMVPAAGMALGVVLATTLGVLTSQRNKDYASELTIWQDTLSKSPHNARALNNVGGILAKSGQQKSAIRYYREALRLKPNYADAHNNLGGALEDPVEAMWHLREALRLAPDLISAHNNIGNALAAAGKTDEAIAHYKHALRLKPDHVDALNGWASALQGEEAIALYREVLKLKPDYGIGYYNLANTLRALGRIDEAIAHYRQALTLMPESAAVHNNLGVAHSLKGDNEKAVEHFRQALRINSNYTSAKQNLEKLLASRK